MPRTTSVADVLKLKEQAQMADLRFVDMPGTWQHFSIPAHDLTAELFEDGIGFDGSSIRGFKEIHESDMLLMLDPTTAFLDTQLAVPTIVVVCDVYEPVTRQPYTVTRATWPAKPKLISNRPALPRPATGGLRPSSSFSMTCATAAVSIHPFTISTAMRAGGTAAKTLAPTWALKSSPNAAISRCLLPTHCKTCAAASSWPWKLPACQIEVHHHEVATAGQCEIDMHLRYPAAHGRQRDDVQVYCQECGPRQRPDRYLHAQAPLWR